MNVNGALRSCLKKTGEVETFKPSLTHLESRVESVLKRVSFALPADPSNIQFQEKEKTTFGQRLNIEIQRILKEQGSLIWSQVFKENEIVEGGPLYIQKMKDLGYDIKDSFEVIEEELKEEILRQISLPQVVSLEYPCYEEEMVAICQNLKEHIIKYNEDNEISVSLAEFSDFKKLKDKTVIRQLISEFDQLDREFKELTWACAREERTLHFKRLLKTELDVVFKLIDACFKDPIFRDLLFNKYMENV